MPEWLTIAAYKWAGAIAGAGLAAWLRRSVRWGIQFVAGVWFGRAGGVWLIGFFSWPDTKDYWLFAGTIMGSAGFGILEIVVAIAGSEMLRKFAASKLTGAK